MVASTGLSKPNVASLNKTIPSYFENLGITCCVVIKAKGKLPIWGFSLSTWISWRDATAY